MTPLDLLLIILAAAALHRIWNYEEVCSRPRAWADRIPYLRKPLLCPACNAFWFGLSAVALWKFIPPWVLMSLVVFIVVRVVPWTYQLIEEKMKAKPNASTAAEKKPNAPQVSQVVPQKLHYTNTMIKGDRTVIIMTALGDFRSSYSVATAVMDQARAIAMVQPTWLVQVWVMENAAEQGWKDMPSNVVLRKIVPHMTWRENISSEDDAKKLRDFMLRELSQYPRASIITHDLLFVSWYTVFAHAIHSIGGFGMFTWYHVPHSLPSSRDGKPQYSTTLPRGWHFIVPVAPDKNKEYAAYYNTSEDKVRWIPNVRDPRSWGLMTPRVQRLVTETKLWQHDFVQVLPICTTRLEAKGFSKVVKTFAFLNESASAFLLICNPNAGGHNGQAIITDAKSKAKTLGLAESRWAFTSDILKDSIPYGLDANEIKTLMSDYGNLFVFPSMSEADSLVALEAGLMRQATVLNSDVPTMHEYADILVPFGTTADVSSDVCRFAANRVLDMKRLLVRDPQRRILRNRNLEGIGNMWSELISGKTGI